MVLCEWAAWLVYCFVAMLLYLPVGGGAARLSHTTLLLSVALPARRGLPSLCCYMLLYRVVWCVCCWFAAVPFCHWKSLSRYAALLICDVASRGLLGPCGAFSLDSFTSCGLFGLCVAWLILPLFPISLLTKIPSCSVAPSFVARLSLLHMRADIDSHMLFYVRFTCGHACCAKCNYALPFVS